MRFDNQSYEFKLDKKELTIKVLSSLSLNSCKDCLLRQLVTMDYGDKGLHIDLKNGTMFLNDQNSLKIHLLLFTSAKLGTDGVTFSVTVTRENDSVHGVSVAVTLATAKEKEGFVVCKNCTTTLHIPPLPAAPAGECVCACVCVCVCVCV